MVPSASSLSPLHLAAVSISEADYVALNFRLWRARPRTRLNHWILGAAVGLLALKVGLEVYQNGQFPSSSSLIFLAVAVLYALLRFGLVRYQLRRGYARNTAAHQPTDFTLTDTEISGRNTLGQFSGKWSLIRRAVWVQPDWLLLYPTETACYYLNMRCLQAPATPAMVAQLLTQHHIAQHRV